jgi:hypothetical protein
MALEASTTVESFGGEAYHRLYIPKDIRTDSDYPLDCGLTVTIRAVGPLLVIVPERRGSLAETVTDVIETEVLSDG